MKEACLLAHHFPGLGNTLDTLDVAEFDAALQCAVELIEAKGGR